MLLNHRIITREMIRLYAHMAKPAFFMHKSMADQAAIWFTCAHQDFSLSIDDFSRRFIAPTAEGLYVSEGKAGDFVLPEPPRSVGLSLVGEEISQYGNITLRGVMYYNPRTDMAEMSFDISVPKPPTQYSLPL